MLNEIYPPGEVKKRSRVTKWLSPFADQIGMGRSNINTASQNLGLGLRRPAS